MRLSIIIPYYNTYFMTDKLLSALVPQTDDSTEIIMVDDGSEEPFIFEEDWKKVKYIRKDNGGVSSARNRGLKEAKGEYIVFIDSDDLVSDDYISQIYKAIEKDPDTVYISWKSIDGRLGKTIQNESDEFNPWNRCVWNRVFKKTYISGMKFDEEKQVAEDDDFLKRLPVPKSKTYIPKQIYFYRAGREGSLTDRAKKGDFRPRIKTQVVIYCGSMQKIGGIETWLYYWCENMYKLYDIMVVFSDQMDGRQIARLSKIVQVMKLNNRLIECDTLINTRITDKIPQEIKAKRIVQMVHGCYSALFCCDIQPERDKVVFVSQAAADTYTNVENYEVIHNFTYPTETNKCLFLITASRFTHEKGGERMIKLAEALRNAGIEFIWFVFSHQNTKLVDGMVKLPETLNIKDYIAKCDYLVQLSDSEGFGYSIVEALELGVPVITTPITVLEELGFQDGQDGYIVPFDMQDINVERLLDIPETKWAWDNDKIRKQWVKLLGKSKPTGEYLKQGNDVNLEIIENYYDMELGRELKVGEVVTMRKARAILIVGCGKGIIVK
jgi:glycosyltransferase involved in cell wall biosynthesis